jgi:hypothetical protein
MQYHSSSQRALQSDCRDSVSNENISEDIRHDSTYADSRIPLQEVSEGEGLELLDEICASIEIVRSLGHVPVVAVSGDTILMWLVSVIASWSCCGRCRGSLGRRGRLGRRSAGDANAVPLIQPESAAVRL